MECNRESMQEIERLYSHYLKYPSISTDSRSIKKGDIFFALKGDNFDGNNFVFQAIEQGASLVVCDNKQIEKGDKILLCENSLTMLQSLATYHRKQLKTTIIGISGTNGKTTTKELIQTVLATKFKTLATKGNLNNHIGVPLTLLSIPYDTEIAIVEMGANHVGEIGFLSNIAMPDLAILTNIGTAHIEGFGSRENIIKTKKELFEFVKNNSCEQSHIFVNADDEALKDEDFSKKTTYSLKTNADVMAKACCENGYAQILFNDCLINSNLVGVYNAYNILAALTIGLHFGVEIERIKQAIENYIPSNNRSQILKTNNNTLILDCYNANPSSCTCSIEAFANMEANHKMVFMGAMKELGDVSIQEHKRVFDLLQSKDFEKIVLIGKEYKEVVNDKVEYFEDSLEFKQFLLNNPIKQATILIKGSRSTKMEVLKDVL